MTESEESCRQQQKLIVDLTGRFEALEDWLNLHYVRLPRPNVGHHFSAEYRYEKKLRGFFARRERRHSNATLLRRQGGHRPGRSESRGQGPAVLGSPRPARKRVRKPL